MQEGRVLSIKNVRVAFKPVGGISNILTTRNENYYFILNSNLNIVLVALLSLEVKIKLLQQLTFKQYY